jgi:hypothetical protein
MNRLAAENVRLAWDVAHTLLGCGSAPGRPQRNFKGCGHWLPKVWTGELCQAREDASRVPRPPHQRQRTPCGLAR